MTILQKIMETKRQEVAALHAYPFQHEPRNIVSLVERFEQSERMNIIAEVKRASPSKGMIHETVNPVKQASIYAQGGVTAISVLTDETYFKGSFDDLRAVAKAVDVPVLCKDFMMDEVQIQVAYDAGASVILLIVAALDDDVLQRLYTYATSLGLNVLVEVHTVEELKRALAIDAKLIGVNNRNLKTFTVDLATTEQIAAHFPFGEGRVLISESGLKHRAEVERVKDAGATGVLVGETLMRAEDVASTIEQLQVTLHDKN